MYFRYRPFSELSIKELMYSELFLASTEECNDPYDSKGFYEFSANIDYWKNLIRIAISKITGSEIDDILIEKIAEKICNICPITYDEALKLDITQFCNEVTRDFSFSLAVSLSLKQIFDVYKPEPSYFACFSKSNNDPLMWSHYASQHHGFCLIFQPIDGKLKQHNWYKRTSINRSTPKGLASNTGCGLPDSFTFQEVKYQDDVKPLCGFHKLPVGVVGKELEGDERIELLQSQSDQLIHKHISWKYEQEVRVIISPGISWLFGETVELTQHERLFHFEPTQLVGIIFGAKMSKKNKDRLIETLLDLKNKISRSQDHERIMFEFAIFQARLSNNKREIQIDLENMISIDQLIDFTHNNFASCYERWQEGWGLKFEGSKSTKVIVKG